MKSNNKQIITVLISIIVAGGVGYYAGTQKAAAVAQGRGNTPGMQGTRGGFARGGVNGGMVNGEVVSSSDTTLTIKGRDGGSRVVLLTGTTKVSKSVEGARTDVKEGSTVLIIGSQNSDGSVTAENIQIRPNGSSSPMIR